MRIDLADLLRNPQEMVIMLQKWSHHAWAEQRPTAGGTMDGGKTSVTVATATLGAAVDCVEMHKGAAHVLLVSETLTAARQAAVIIRWAQTLQREA